jgi:extradiol dioxygenase family protein
MERPKIRHIAVHTPDVEKTAAFYKTVFEMEEVGRTDSPIATGVYLSDGYLNLAVLTFKVEHAADRLDGLGPVMGLHHFGFATDDLDELRRRLADTETPVRKDLMPTATSGYFEEKYVGPESVMIDISHGWITEKRKKAEEPATAR